MVFNSLTVTLSRSEILALHRLYQICLLFDVNEPDLESDSLTVTLSRSEILALHRLYQICLLFDVNDPDLESFFKIVNFYAV